jgi:glycosyltransferase involved in cell wall biosynthesis
VRVWIVNPYGTLPSEGWREYRSSMLARALASRGHQVVWFISDFEHRTKTFRQTDRADPALPEGVEVRCLRSQPYRRNISLGRVAYERAFGHSFVTAAAVEAGPDLIVLAEPALFFGPPILRFAKSHGIPVVLDILDLWPELFHVLLPQWMRSWGRWLFAPFYRQRERHVRQAAAVVAVTQDYRTSVVPDEMEKPSAVFYLGVDIAELKKARDSAVSYRQPSQRPRLTVAYAGTLGDAYDIPCVIEAVKMLSQQEPSMRFIFAGAGPRGADIQQLAADLPSNVRFLGSISPLRLIEDVYAQAEVGLCSYSAGSTVSMPVKFYDYMGSGLAVVSSLGGEIRGFVEAGAGLQYQAGDSRSLASTLMMLATQPELLASTRAKAEQFGMSFDQRAQHVSYVRFLEQVCQASR